MNTIKTLSLFFVLLLAACQPVETEPAEPVEATPVAMTADAEADRAALVQIDEAYSEALRTGDHAAIAALFADDAIQLPENRPIVRGRAAIEVYQAENNVEPAPSYSATVEEVVFAEAGDMGYLIGTDTESEDGAGKYITVYQRIDGDWKIVAEAWNSDAPDAADG